jgi:hypothetical protein
MNNFDLNQWEINQIVELINVAIQFHKNNKNSAQSKTYRRIKAKLMKYQNVRNKITAFEIKHKKM